MIGQALLLTDMKVIPYVYSVLILVFVVTGLIGNLRLYFGSGTETMEQLWKRATDANNENYDPTVLVKVDQGVGKIDCRFPYVYKRHEWKYSTDSYIYNASQEEYTILELQASDDKLKTTAGWVNLIFTAFFNFVMFSILLSYYKLRLTRAALSIQTAGFHLTPREGYNTFVNKINNTCLSCSMWGRRWQINVNDKHVKPFRNAKIVHKAKYKVFGRTHYFNRYSIREHVVIIVFTFVFFYTLAIDPTDGIYKWCIIRDLANGTNYSAFMASATESLAMILLYYFLAYRPALRNYSQLKLALIRSTVTNTDNLTNNATNKYVNERAVAAYEDCEQCRWEPVIELALEFTFIFLVMPFLWICMVLDIVCRIFCLRPRIYARLSEYIHSQMEKCRVTEPIVIVNAFPEDGDETAEDSNSYPMDNNLNNSSDTATSKDIDRGENTKLLNSQKGYQQV